MKRLLFALVAVALCTQLSYAKQLRTYGTEYVAVSDSICQLFGGGDGTTSNPFQIGSENQFVTFMLMEADSIKDASFVLTQSLDFSNYTNALLPVDEYGKCVLQGVPSFQGIFDGGGNSISNIVMVSANGHGASSGLFGNVTSSRIYDLTLANVSTTLNQDQIDESGNVMYMGALIGLATNSSLNNCNLIKVNIESYCEMVNDIGALAGCLENSSAVDCSATEVTIQVQPPTKMFTYTSRGMGLLIGELNDSQLIGDQETICVSGSLSLNPVNSEEFSPSLGGAVGYACGECYIKGVQVGSAEEYATVSYINTGEAMSYTTAGGFIGFMDDISTLSDKDNILIESCEAYTNVEVLWKSSYKQRAKYNYYGGFIGSLRGNTGAVRMVKCSSYGDVTTRVEDDYLILDCLAMGGFAGSVYRGSIEQCNWYGQFVGIDYVDDAFYNTESLTFLAAGGFVGSAGQANMDDFPTYDEKYTTSFWNCYVRTGTAAKSNAALITSEKQIDRYFTGNISIGEADDSAFEAIYDPENYIYKENYAHVISIPISPGRSDFASNTGYSNALGLGAGGFVGWGSATFEKCYAESVYVEGSMQCGGFAGVLFEYTLDQEYDTTEEEYNAVQIMQVSDCYTRDVYVTGNCNLGGFVGYIKGYTYDADYQSTKYSVNISECKAYNVYSINPMSSRFSSSTYPAHIGGFAAQVYGCTLSDITALSTIGTDVEISGISGIGGVVGTLTKSKLTNTMSFGAMGLSGVDNAGGIVGFCKESTLTNATNGIFIYGNGSLCVGGVVGTPINSTLDRVFNLGALVPVDSGNNYGGIAGYYDEGNTLNHAFSYAPIEMINSPKYARDIEMDFLKIIAGCVKVFVYDKQPVSLIFHCASVVVESTLYATETKCKGSSGGLFGGFADTDDCIQITIDKYESIKWDHDATTQSNGATSSAMRPCKATTTELMDFDFDNNVGLAGELTDKFSYYIPYDCYWLYDAMVEDVNAAE